MDSWKISVYADPQDVDKVYIPFCTHAFKAETDWIVNFVISNGDKTYEIELSGIVLMMEYKGGIHVEVDTAITATTTKELFEIHPDMELLINDKSILRAYEGFEGAPGLEANIKDAKELLASKDAIMEAARSRLDVRITKYMTSALALKLLNMVFTICSMV